MFRLLDVSSMEYYDLIMSQEKPDIEVSFRTDELNIDIHWSNGKTFKAVVPANEHNMTALENIMDALYNKVVNITVVFYNGNIHTWSWTGDQHNTIDDIFRQLVTGISGVK